MYHLPIGFIGVGIAILPVLFLLVIIWAIRREMTPEIEVEGDTNIAGPTEGVRWPIIGNSLFFVGVRSVEESWAVMAKLWKMREKLMSLWVVNKLVIFVKDAKITEVLMATSKCNMKDGFFYAAFALITDGVFSRNGKRWSDLRRPLDKMMHHKLIHENYYHVFVDKANQLCEAMHGLAGKGVVELSDFFKCTSLDMVLETLFGVPGTQMKNNTWNLPKLTEEVVEIIFEKILRPELNLKAVYRVSDLARRVEKVREKLKPVLTEIMEKRHKELAEYGLQPEDPDFIPENYVDVVAQVVARENMPQEERIFSLFDLIVAGFDTSSIAMVSTCLFLSMFPEYQEKAYKEQKEIMGESLEAPTVEEISKMEYLSMVFNETLRHTGPPVVARTLSSEIEIDGHKFPKGSTLSFVFSELFRNPQYFERPFEFYPDHFLPEKVAQRPKGAFLPFSGGARKCPGKRFAQVSSSIVLSMLIRRFKFSTTMKFDDIEKVYLLLTESKSGYKMEVTLRSAAPLSTLSPVLAA